MTRSGGEWEAGDGPTPADVQGALFTGAEIGKRLVGRDKWLWILLGFLGASMFFLTLASVSIDYALWSRLQDLDKRAPCPGCFDSYKWRVDELRAIHKLGAVSPPEASDEQARPPAEEGDRKR